MSSSRLPGKALLTVAGKPLLGHLLDRLECATLLDDIIVATSTASENDAIASYCARRGTACFRGSEDDVLARTLGALQSAGADIGVEVFGDCPLIDPAIVDAMIDTFQRSNGAYAFVGNDLETTYPPGMEVEVFTVAALADSATRVSDLGVREHGTLFIRQHPELYPQLSVTAPLQHRFPEMELEVDSAEDVPVVAAILEHFVGRPTFSLDDIVTFMRQHPNVGMLNAGVERRWKAFRQDHG